MKYKIEQYERCETTSSGLIEDHLIGITKPSIDRMLRMDNAGDCIALYTFYCYTRKWQKNTIPRATSEFAMEGLKWGRERFSKAKANLLQLGLIEDVQRIGENGRVLGWYIGVKFAQNATLGTFNVAEIPDNHPTGFPQGGQTRVRENRIQIPITNIKIPNTNKEIQKESSAVASHSSTQTNLFPTNPSEANASGSANAKLKSADGKETAPHCAAPPRTRKSREPKLVDEKFIAELQRLNPDKDVEREVKAAQTWLLSRPDRKYTRGFLANWVIRSKNIINPDKFHNNNSF